MNKQKALAEILEDLVYPERLTTEQVYLSIRDKDLREVAIELTALYNTLVTVREFLEV